MKKNFYPTTILIFGLLILAGCRMDQPLFAGAVYNGGVAILVAIVGIIIVLKKIL